MTPHDELHQAARKLANLYHELEELKFAPTRTPNVRVQKPTFRSMDPAPDQGWAFNHEHELMRDTPDERVPGGLENIAKDALDYTHARRHRARDYDSAGYRDHDATPAHLCAYIARYAQEITTNFPAADDLLEVINHQRAYLNRQIEKRHGTRNLTPRPPDTMATGYGTAADLAPLVTAAIGHTIDRKDVTYWGKSGRITPFTQPDGTTIYRLQDVIKAALNYTDKRRGPTTA